VRNAVMVRQRSCFAIIAIFAAFRTTGWCVPPAAAVRSGSILSIDARPELRLQGRVLRAGDRAPISSARVDVPGIEGDIRTDADGRFEISIPDSFFVEHSEIRLSVSAAGFEQSSLSVRDGDSDVTVVLSPSAYVLPGTSDIVVEAAGLDRPAFELPYAGRFISRDEVLAEESNGVSKAVSLVPGISSVGGGFHSAPAIRGLARNRVILLVDGVRTAAIRTIGGHLGFIHPFAVGAVEVVKGPFSTLYGHDAMAGVIRVDTLRPEIRDNGFTLHGGGFARYESAAKSPNGAFYLAGGVPKATFLVTYGRVAEEDYRTGGGGILPQSGFTLTSFLAKTEIRPADRHRFEMLYLRTEGRNIGKVSGDPSLINTHPSEKNDVASLLYEWKIGGALFRTVEARASRGLFTLASDFRILTGTRTVQSLRDLGEDGYGLTLKTTMTPGSRLVLFAGLDAYFQENQRIDGVKKIYVSGQDTPISSTLLNEVPDAATRDVGVFVQGTAVLAEKWDLVFGARGDAAGERVEEETGTRNRAFKTEWNGILGMVHKFSPAVRLSLNVGTAFRLPTPKDRYFNGQTPAGINIGNPDLKPEHSLNTDLVLKFRSRTEGRHRFEGSLAAFVNRFRDLIVIKWDKPTGVRTGVFQNAGRAEIYGLEAAATLAAGDGWIVYAAATAVGAAVHGNDEVLDDLPPFGGILQIRRLFDRGGGWACLAFRGAATERRTSAGDFPASAFLLADFSAGWRIGRAWIVQAAVENLADASYREFFDLPSIRRKGRSFNVSLSAEY